MPAHRRARSGLRPPRPGPRQRPLRGPRRDKQYPPHRSAQLAPTELRQLATTLIVGADPGMPPRAASLAVDAIDAALWGMLGSLGLTPREAAVVADVLWAAR